MKFRGLLIALVLLAALGGLVWWSNRAEKAKEGKPAPDAAPKIAEIPDDQIQQIEFRKKDAEVTTIKKNDKDVWAIAAPKALAADQDSVRSVTSTLSSLSSDRVVEEKAADLGAFGLGKPALEVVVTRKDGKTHKLFFGDESPTGTATFARLDGDARVFTVANYNKSSLDKTWKDLRDKRLLTFDSDKLSRVELVAKDQTIELGKNAKNEWTILKPKPLRADNFQCEELVRKLKDAKMDTSVSEEDAKKAEKAFGPAKAVSTAKVTDAGGTQQLEVRKDKDNNYYAKSSVVDGIHKLTSDLGDALGKGLDDLRNKKLFDFGYNDPQKVEVREGAKVLTFTKSGDKWTLGGKNMDSIGVQSLIDKLRDLQSKKFLERNVPATFLDLTVVSQDGKTTDKVQISKDGSTFLAKRENEPSVYEVEQKSVEDIQKAAGEVKEAQPEKKDDKKDARKK